MNISAKQKQTPRHREETWGFQWGWGQGRIGSLGLADTNYRVDKQQGPTVEHREL